jgi:ParB family transcriptional regulator, chromosome partitioning protein
MGERSLAPQPTEKTGETGYAELAISAISADPEQPRRFFEATALNSLAASLKEHGLLEPVVVHRVGEGRFQLIAGERRWRAAQTLGWTHLPAVVRSAHNQSNLILALVENLQRADLSPIEEAEAYDKLRREHRLTQAKIAKLVGRERATVANALRLLNLTPAARTALTEGKIDKGHARALLGLDDPDAQTRIIEQMIHEAWSVRATEKWVRQHKASSQRPQTSPVSQKSSEPTSFSALSSVLGAEVQLNGRKITLSASNREQAILVIERLTQMVRNEGRQTSPGVRRK